MGWYYTCSTISGLKDKYCQSNNQITDHVCQIRNIPFMTKWCSTTLVKPAGYIMVSR